MSRGRAWAMLLLAVLLGVVWAWQQGMLPTLGAKSAQTDATSQIDEADLPRQARDTLKAIDRGGPFRYHQDGAVFRTDERVPPQQPRGYYHEYTVDTPGSPDRGPRRIVTGSNGEFYWTPDHYRSFVKIRRQ